MSALSLLKSRLAEINAVDSACAMMEWDQQCLMPAGSAEARAQHVGILSRMSHELSTSDTTLNLIQKATEEGGSDQDKALLRVVKRETDQRVKIPADLVEKKSKLSALGHEKWVHARANNDFKSFAPTLEELFEICRQEAEYLGYKDHIYDALTDQYEEGATKAGWDAMFATIRQPLVELIQRIKDCGHQRDDSYFTRHWSNQAQSDFTEMLAKAIGFDFNRGRQDTAAHPFCTGWSINDVRITTRFKDFLPSAIFGTLHECGHAMYEQGSNPEFDLTPLAGGVSLGVHESQSRTWENIVGRSKAFWQYFLPDLRKAFPELPAVSLDDFYKDINKVEADLIRVEADEVTYNMHIMVRYEIECAILTGELAIKDLPEFWNSKYKEYLGITPENDAVGCLQDVHWSGGSVGYFPTYSMGNILSYQIWECLVNDLGDVDALMSQGKFEPILGWLQEKIYRPARTFPPAQLLTKVTGRPLDAKPYVEGITKKYVDVYGLK